MSQHDGAASIASTDLVRWKEAVAGAVAGAMTVLMLHPLDVVKTRLQVQEKSSRRYRGSLHAFRTVLRREGARGLYAGLTPSLIGNAVSWGCYWVAWKSISEWHMSRSSTDHLPWNMKLLCGIEAGVLVTLMTNPLWVVKTRMQLDTGTARGAVGLLAGVSNTLRAVRSIQLSDGARGFYRGLGPALMLCGHGAIQMAIYEEIKQWRVRRSGSGHSAPAAGLEPFFMGAGAKLSASLCTYPLQVARSRMQQRLLGSKVQAYVNLPRTLASIVRRDGFVGLYSGFITNAVRVCPQAGLQFFFYEATRRMLGQ